ncbi:MAG: hypothetical protein ACI9JD_001102 [Rhodococcus sp. (in: high G+C Gram-positive bacteria)]|jgi:hypothetical protein
MDVADRASVSRLHNDVVFCYQCCNRGPITRGTAPRTGTALAAGCRTNWPGRRRSAQTTAGSVGPSTSTGPVHPARRPRLHRRGTVPGPPWRRQSVLALVSYRGIAQQSLDCYRRIAGVSRTVVDVTPIGEFGNSDRSPANPPRPRLRSPVWLAESAAPSLASSRRE